MDNWLQIVAAPLLVALGGLAAWFIQSRVEQVRATEERLTAERRKVYAEILEPYIRMFAGVKSGEGVKEATEKILSFEYRKTSFELGLVGSDDVVRAYNDMMQFFFKAANEDGQDSSQGILLWGALLLEIRRSLGNKDTKLDALDMLRGMITDIERLQTRSS